MERPLNIVGSFSFSRSSAPADPARLSARSPWPPPSPRSGRCVLSAALGAWRRLRAEGGGARACAGCALALWGAGAAAGAVGAPGGAPWRHHGGRGHGSRARAGGAPHPRAPRADEGSACVGEGAGSPWSRGCASRSCARPRARVRRCCQRGRRARCASQPEIPALRRWCGPFGPPWRPRPPGRPAARPLARARRPQIPTARHRRVARGGLSACAARWAARRPVPPAQLPSRVRRLWALQSRVSEACGGAAGRCGACRARRAPVRDPGTGVALPVAGGDARARRGRVRAGGGGKGRVGRTW